MATTELDDIVSVQCETHELIDNALRSYLRFTTTYRGSCAPNDRETASFLGSGLIFDLTEEYLPSEYDLARCSCKLLASSLFAAHTEYVRRQIIYGLLQVTMPVVFMPRGHRGRC